MAFDNGKAVIPETLPSAITLEVSVAEYFIVTQLRSVVFGSVEVQVQDGIPFFVRKVETTKLM